MIYVDPSCKTGLWKNRKS